MNRYLPHSRFVRPTTRNAPTLLQTGAKTVTCFAKILLATAALLPLYPAAAQNLATDTTAPTRSEQSGPDRFDNPVAATSFALQPARALLDGAYAANANIANIEIELQSKAVVADGRSPFVVTIRIRDKDGKPLAGEALVTIENTGGRLLLPGAQTPQFGAATNDADRNVPGTQFKVVDGAGSFSLIAPDVPSDVKLRLTAGGAVAEATVGFDPDVRNLIAAGLIEGALRLSAENSALFRQARLNDGFEQELRHFTTKFNNGKGRLGARTSVFLKGKVKGDVLLTMAYDSDKDTRARLLRDVRPEQVYPVYGDASVRGFDARTSGRLYVRVDNKRNYLLYGDTSTGAEFSQNTGAGIVASGNLRQLGAYNRTLTGVRTHLESDRGFVNIFAARDSLKQVIEEFNGNGTSGPIAINSASALENSEKIEIIVRDKNARDRVRSVTALQRLVDYTFEPFNGRILLARPLPSLDPSGNPISLRITYEVDQGGEDYWLAGVDGQSRFGKHITVGGSFVKDFNPLSPYELGSVNAGIRLGKNTSFIGELAQSRARTYSQTPGGPRSIFPTNTANELSNDASDLAGRVEMVHDSRPFKARIWYLRSGAEFNNANSGLLPNRQEFGFEGRSQLDERISVNVQAQRTEDRSTVAQRDSAAVSFDWQAASWLNLNLGVRKIKENGALGAGAGISRTPVSPGSIFNGGGGFFGNGPTTIIDPVTGLPSLASGFNGSTPFTNASNNIGANSIPTVDATTVYGGARLQLGKRLEVSASAEASVQNNVNSSSERPARVEAGASYQLAERTRAYVRAETQTGLAAATSLTPADQSSSILVGIDSSYREGQSIFSEYRLRDATNNQNAQLATGLRNAWQIREGLVLSLTGEYLKILNGQNSGQGSNAYAIGTGIDYSAASLWKASVKFDWRHVNDNKFSATDDSSDSYLSSLLLARKLDRNWTLLARNYLLVANNYSQLGSAAQPAAATVSRNPTSWQNRAQLGAAYRPVDHNRFDALFKIEYKRENNISYQDESSKTWVGSLNTVWHPSRPWTVSNRAAIKSVSDRFFNSEGGAKDSYKAMLFGGRVIYDITEKWDVAVLGSVLSGKAANQQGRATQYAVGGAVGRSVGSNVWVSAGYNFTGFNDRDLSGSEYTNKGFYLTLRFKFDEDLFKSKDKNINRARAR
jgi:hypothetical protein